MLIEDDHDIAEAISYQLEKVGLQVKVARTGEEGLEAVRRGADLVLLDLNLPGMDGLEVCRMIRRKQPTTAHVPIIIVSARGGRGGPRAGPGDGRGRLRGEAVQPEGAGRALPGRAAPRRAGGGEAPQGYRDENFEVEFDSFIVRYRGPGDPAHPQGVRALPLPAWSARAACSRASGCSSASGATRRDVETRSIDAHIRRLRLKLGPARDHIETVVGLGYRFVK